MKDKDEVKYFSTDKMYKVKKRKLNQQVVFYIFLAISFILLGSGMYISIMSFQESGKSIVNNYSEKGKADYTVYLKENNYYDSKYLKSGMKYVASLINTINTNFNYEIHSEENMNLKYKYKIIGTLQIMDQTDENKVLYTKDEELLKEVTRNTESNNLVINEDLDIDYDKYNNYVNSYKKDYGLSVNSKLVLTMKIDVLGQEGKEVEELKKNSKLQITIPLSEQTVDISIDTDKIENSDSLVALNNFTIESITGLVIGIVLILIGIIVLFVNKKRYDDYKAENIYTITVKKILNEYDSIIVNGTVTVNEKKYNNIVYPEEFGEMVDASINLKTPILYYEVIPGEKCFFVITKGDTLYKFRLTKSYLEREENDKEENSVEHNEPKNKNKKNKKSKIEDIDEDENEEEIEEI